MSSDEDDIIMLSSAIILLDNEIGARKKRKRSIWVKHWLERRNEKTGLGGFALLHNELRVEDKMAYKNYLRMSEECFNVLLSKVEHMFSYRDTNFRQCITPRDRLAATLRFLATGETIQSLSYNFRIGRSTLCKIISEVLEAIYECLKDEFIKVPTTTEEWHKIANKFNNKWNFPNCFGAIDGKHISFRPPRNQGSYYRNYKGYDSIVLLAICDADYEFICIDVGVNGRISDGGVFANSIISGAISNNLFDIPENENLPGTNTKTPFVLVGDDAFPLSTRLLKPFRYHGLTQKQKIYNYRVSRARRVIENSFGILANRFRILLNPMVFHVDKVEKITIVCCILHNYLIKNARSLYMDIEDIDDLQSLQSVSFRTGNRPKMQAVNLREIFMDYFNRVGAMRGQTEYVHNKNNRK